MITGDDGEAGIKKEGFVDRYPRNLSLKKVVLPDQDNGIVP